MVILVKHFDKYLNSLIELLNPLHAMLKRVDIETEEKIKRINDERIVEIAQAKSDAKRAVMLAKIAAKKNQELRSINFASEPIEPFVRRAVSPPKKRNSQIAIVTAKVPSIAPTGKRCQHCNDALKGRARAFCQEKNGVKRFCSNQWHYENR